jgi:hypothetical protein
MADDDNAAGRRLGPAQPASPLLAAAQLSGKWRYQASG